MTRRRSAILAMALALSLVLSGCGDDSSPIGGDNGSGESGDDAVGFTVTVSRDDIEVPDEVTGGVVQVTLETDIEGAEANFSKVASGTTEDQFKQEIVKAVSGGPIPGFIEATTGLVGEGGATSTLILPEGDYIAWSIAEPPEGRDDEGGGDEGGDDDLVTTTTAAAAGETARGQAQNPGGAPPSGTPEGGAPEGEAPEGEGGGGPEGGGPPAEAVLTAAFTVTPGEAGDLPEAGGNRIIARDYTFDVKVKAEAEEFVFRNEGPEQFHHVVLMNFGDLEPSAVEQNLLTFLESEEGAPPPPALKDVDFEDLEGGSSAVLSPGLGATVSAKAFESGNTYAALCFIADRTGGPPHAIGKGMRTVFTVE